MINYNALQGSDAIRRIEECSASHGVVIAVFEKPFNGTAYNPDESSPRHA